MANPLKAGYQVNAGQNLLTGASYRYQFLCGSWVFFFAQVQLLEAIPAVETMRCQIFLAEYN